jgi:hypothetical protein
MSDANLGPVANAFDSGGSSADTYWQSLCGRYTTDRDVQPDNQLDFVCGSATAAGASSVAWGAKTSGAPYVQQPYIEAQFSSPKEVKCVTISQTAPGGVRFSDKLTVMYFHVAMNVWKSLGSYTVTTGSAHVQVQAN